MQEAPVWITTLLQILSPIVSILAIITFVRTGQKAKIEQAESIVNLANSIKVIADAQHRTDNNFDDAQKNAAQEHKELREKIDGVIRKQTTLCAMHTINHPGQVL